MNKRAEGFLISSLIHYLTPFGSYGIVKLFKNDIEGFTKMTNTESGAFEMDEILTIECDDCGEQSVFVQCPNCYDEECGNCNLIVGCVNEFGPPTVYN